MIVRALVISDTHGFLDNADKLFENYSEIKTVIHLGDLVEDVEKLKKKFTDKDFFYVAGNNDFCNDVPNEKMITLGGKKILLTHGHHHRVNSNMLNISLWCKEQRADAVLFGHTHYPLLDESMGIVLFNPGSISLPRNFQGPNYGILEINERGVIHGGIYRFYFDKKDEKIF